MPDLNAWVAVGVESFGSALMIIGLAKRPIGALITFMIRQRLLIFSNSKIWIRFSKPIHFSTFDRGDGILFWSWENLRRLFDRSVLFKKDEQK
ncbi:MAG: hypothetical protein K8F91_27510 [Candidatus Obscuribacterales bacterium]|nr:hypothetical protein [Candidatus Obscuribacterales bacterium]